MMNVTNSDIRIVRITDMYGYCKCVKLYRGREEIGDSYFSAGEAGGTWYIGACGYETTLKNDRTLTTEENLSAVELVLKLQVSAADALKSARAA